MNSLQEYADLFERLGLTELCAEEDGKKLLLKKEPVFPSRIGDPAGNIPRDFPSFRPEEPKADAPAANATAPAEDIPEGNIVKAPLLGIFHAKFGETPRKVGDTVHKGDVLCAIEAMKMMNEVTSPKDGTIREILAADGALVEYHQKLFVIA